MKKLNFFTKTVVIVLAIAVIAFVASLFIFPKEWDNPREIVAVFAIPVGLLAGLTFIVMLIVKRWRKASFIPLSIGLCSLIVFFMYLWDGVHFKQIPEKSIASACRSYCKNDNSRINHRSLKVISIESDSEENDQYICSATGTTYSGNLDTVVFFVSLDKYNRCIVHDSYRVVGRNLTTNQLTLLEKGGHTHDNQIIDLDWDSYWEYLRQAAARELFIEMSCQIVQNWFDVDGWHIQMKITPKKNIHDLRIVLFNGYFDNNRGFSYVESVGFVNWQGNFRRGQSYSKEFIIHASKRYPNFNYCIMAEDVFSDEWVEEYLLSKMDDDIFWEYFANLDAFEKRGEKLALVSGSISGTMQNANLSESVRHELITNLYANLYYIATNYYFLDQFTDSEYNLNNIKASIEN